MLDDQPNVIDFSQLNQALADVFEVDYFTYPRYLSDIRTGTLEVAPTKSTHLASMDCNGKTSVSEHRAFIVDAAQNYPTITAGPRMRELHLQPHTEVSYPTLHAVIRLYGGDL